MAPGPTEVPPAVLQAQLELPYHRGPRFGAVIQGCVEALQRILFTKSDVLLFTGSGSLGMESAVTNLFSPGDKILVLNTGNFADRFAKIAEIWGIEAVQITYEWGCNAQAADVEKALADDDSFKAVLCQHSETSTGIVNDVEAIGRVVKDRPQLFVVDGISGVGAAPLRLDDWGIDVLIGGSQKALMTPRRRGRRTSPAPRSGSTQTGRPPRRRSTSIRRRRPTRRRSRSSARSAKRSRWSRPKASRPPGNDTQCSVAHAAKA
jgi:aspartate aminotransferase-like enzyme